MAQTRSLMLPLLPMASLADAHGYRGCPPMLLPLSMSNLGQLSPGKALHDLGSQCLGILCRQSREKPPRRWVAPALAKCQVWLLGPRATLAACAELSRGPCLLAANEKKAGGFFPLGAILTIMANGFITSAMLPQRLEFRNLPDDRSAWILKATCCGWLLGDG